ncbi:PKD domain-containing protein, partial [Winogradskyella immobilis]
MKTNTINLIENIRGKAIALLTLVFFFVGLSQVQAQCTIPTGDITVSDFNNFVINPANNCNGTVIIPDNARVLVDQDFTISNAITSIIIQDGGQIVWTSNSTLSIGTSTSIQILNTTDTVIRNGSGALASEGPCNNNRRINIGNISYSACVGGGNVCFIFEELVALGGTPVVDPNIMVIAAGDGNDVCFPDAEIITLVSNLPDGVFPIDNETDNISAYVWTQLSGPGTTTFTIGTPDTSVPNNVTLSTIATVTTPGSYEFQLAIQVPLGAPGSGCENDFAEVTTPAIAIDFLDAIVADINFTPDANCGRTIDFTGISNDPYPNPPGTNDITYSWDFGDGNTSTEQNPIHTYASDGNFDVTLTVSDIDGPISECNVDTASVTVTVADNDPPVFDCSTLSQIDLDTGVNCSNDTDVTTPVAIDNCDGNINGVGTRSDGAALNDPWLLGSTTITWTFTDTAGNSIQCSQDVVVTDNTNPTINCPADITVNVNNPLTCSTPITITTPTANDNCPNVTVSGTRDDGLGLNQPYPVGITTITWVATDSAGNTSNIICEQLITVIDNMPPTFNEALPANETVECDAIPDAVTLTVTDNCNPNVEVIFNEERTDGSCPNNFTLVRTWTANDGANGGGNEITHTQTITVQDTTAPVAPSAPANETYQCIDDVPAPGDLTAVDNCLGDITVTGVDSTDNSNPCNIIITRTWTFTDNCTNTSSVSQTITVADTTAPVAPSAPADVTVQCVDEIPAMIDLTAV